MEKETKEDFEKSKIVDEKNNETIDYEVYADSPKTIITVPWDPNREERDHECYQKFLQKMKKIEEEKAKIEKEPEGPALKKENKPTK